MNLKILNSDRVRNFIFGVEDSLVSTVGMISGVAAAEASRSTILITGTVLIFVEAFSMAVGSLLSDNSAREFEQKSPVALGESTLSSVIMFFSYFLSGFVIIAPYIAFSISVAFLVSIVVSLVALFILGILSGLFSNTSCFKKGVVMMVVGGLAVAIGVAIGTIVS